MHLKVLNADIQLCLLYLKTSPTLKLVHYDTDEYQQEWY